MFNRERQPELKPQPPLGRPLIDPEYHDAYWTLFGSLMLRFFPDGQKIAEEIQADEQSQTGFRVGREVGQLTRHMIQGGIVELEALAYELADREAKLFNRKIPPKTPEPKSRLDLS